VSAFDGGRFCSGHQHLMAAMNSSDGGAIDSGAIDGCATNDGV